MLQEQIIHERQFQEYKDAPFGVDLKIAGEFTRQEWLAFIEKNIGSISAYTTKYLFARLSPSGYIDSEPPSADINELLEQAGWFDIRDSGAFNTVIAHSSTMRDDSSVDQNNGGIYKTDVWNPGDTIVMNLGTVHGSEDDLMSDNMHSHPNARITVLTIMQGIHGFADLYRKYFGMRKRKYVKGYRQKENGSAKDGAVFRRDAANALRRQRELLMASKL